LAVSGNVSAGANVLTVGSAVAGSGTVANGMSLTGVISGSGGTYGGTATSIVKDGAGAVYLSGNNTFTGDVRILDGVLNVIFGASTNALGVGSDLFISSFGTLGVNGNASVSSFQGAGEGDSGNVLFSGNSILTVNGAGKTMTMAGNIEGDGGLRVAGNSSTLVTLTGDNTYTRATTITAGTLALAGTGGKQALRSTSAVSVGSSGKLLLQTSNQVRDSAAITLSGGTIQRGSGVSEVFGNLNLTTASTLDFGIGAAGTLSFGTYTPSSLLTIQNFDFGSTLTFRSNLSSSITNTSLFTFQNGGISSYSWNSSTSTFTITAIPEPSTYLAVAGLIAVMLWPSRRRIFRGVGRVVGVRG
jgi:autotransporter-associated beta strand protein